MDDQQRSTLQWLSQQYFEEMRSLRSAEDNLFNWASSTLLGALGALTGLRAINGDGWSFWWRLLLWGGVIAAVGAILTMAYLIHRNYRRHEEKVMRILAQVDPNSADLVNTVPEEELGFYIRWGAILVLGLVILGLVYMLG